jgi:hypothetical protein
MRYGAGRPGWHGKTTGKRTIDVRKLQRDGHLSAHYRLELQWASGASIRLETSPDEVTLRYRYKERQDDWRDVNQRVAVIRTPCHYGGSRSWFACPRCGERVAILYLWNVPVCRKCGKLVYPSQAEDPIGRSWRRSQKIAARLGQRTDGWMTPSRPKGMRLATFERIREQWWAEVRLREGVLVTFRGE